MKLRILIVLLLCGLPFSALADGTDAAGNYVAGTGAGANLETDGTGTIATGNVYVGPYAGVNDSTGNANTGVGYRALGTLASGRGNIGLGYMAGTGNSAVSNRLYIHNQFYPTHGIFGDLANGYIGINNIAPTVALDITGNLAVSGTFIPAGNVTIMGDSLVLSAETIVQWPAEADTSTVRITTAPDITFYGADGDTWATGISASDQALFTGAGGGYDFDGPVTMQSTLDIQGGAVTFENDETLDNTVNGTLRAYGKFLVSGDSTAITAETIVEHISEVDTSAVVFVGGDILLYGSDGDTGTIDITTADALNLTGFSGGVYIDVAVTNSVNIITTDGNVALGVTQSGSFRRASGLASKRTDTLPAAVAGLFYDFSVDDADSLLIGTANGDSLIDGKTSAEEATKQTSTISGSCRLTAIDATYWIMTNKTGTWTEYVIVE